eukprot:TRINITY_DN13155_c1_g1_i1.p2 TRINITY_DN13155_c1_g1~~TRINITY_DN13155_c1_g1_i1.p2  ORF type:complete len:119 (+),score=6.65 TRINITY_DN13155_c1_g1_i1:25-357(+)
MEERIRKKVEWMAVIIAYQELGTGRIDALHHLGEHGFGLDQSLLGVLLNSHGMRTCCKSPCRNTVYPLAGHLRLCQLCQLRTMPFTSNWRHADPPHHSIFVQGRRQGMSG